MSVNVLNMQNYDSIQEKDVVTLKTYNESLKEIRKVEKCNSICSIRKISDNEYIDLKTGEVKECNHIENRSQNVNSIKLSMKKIRDLINANISPANKKQWLFITLTYRKNMKDTKKVYHDFRNFKKRFKEKYPSFEKYINVIEPQGRGAWHLHCFFGFTGNAPYIANLQDLWLQGFVNIRQIGDIDNLGAYLSAYLCDIEVSDNNIYECQRNGMQQIQEVEKEVEENGKKIKKKFIKGGRLYMYPPKMNIVRHSKDIKKPIEEKILYKNARKKVGLAQPTYKNCKIITTENFSNVIIYEQYNLSRKQKSN